MASVEEDRTTYKDLLLPDLVKPHVESFNFFADHGIEQCVAALQTYSIPENAEIGTPRVRYWFENVRITKPFKTDSSKDHRLFPAECREGGGTYSGELLATIAFQVGSEPEVLIERKMGLIPVMVQSRLCHLEHLSPSELVARKEEATEIGGYFILNGNERIIRMLLVPRRNVVTAIIRPSLANRGPDFTKYGVYLRSVRRDQSSLTVTLHYLATGACMFRFTMSKQEFFVPAVVLLKAFMETTDRNIFLQITQGDFDNNFVTDRTELMIRQTQSLGLKNRKQVLAYLGRHFRIMLQAGEGDMMNDVDCGRQLCRFLFGHCEVMESEEEINRAKFDILVHMTQKLYALVQGRIKPDNPDALAFQEFLLPGHLYTMIFKEKLDDFLLGVRAQIQRDMKKNPEKVLFWEGPAYFKSAMDKQVDIGMRMRHFLVTGNFDQ